MYESSVCFLQLNIEKSLLDINNKYIIGKMKASSTKLFNRRGPVYRQSFSLTLPLLTTKTILRGIVSESLRKKNTEGNGILPWAMDVLDREPPLCSHLRNIQPLLYGKCP